MTLEEFNNTEFRMGMKVKYRNKTYDIVGVDFDLAKIGICFASISARTYWMQIDELFLTT